jgi:hypothetical protein
MKVTTTSVEVKYVWSYTTISLHVFMVWISTKDNCNFTLFSAGKKTYSKHILTFTSKTSQDEFLQSHVYQGLSESLHDHRYSL